MISQSEFRHIINKYIMPLVAGTKVVTCRKCSGKKTPEEDPSVHYLALGAKDAPVHPMHLSRGQAFTKDEKRLIDDILDRWNEVFSAHQIAPKHIGVVAEQCKLEAIADFMDPGSSELLLNLLEAMMDWSGQSYEGQRIAFSLGVETREKKKKGVFLDDILEEDFLKVTSSGTDTLLVCGADGSVLRHESLFEPDQAKLNELDDGAHNLYAPLAFISIAQWAVGQRFAVTLTVDGEILLFKNGSLVFARRRGKWIFFTHSAYIAGMGRQRLSHGVRKALYQTILDVSFRRTGGCLGMWHFGKEEEKSPISQADRLDTPLEPAMDGKNIFMRTLIGGRKFHELPRKLRQGLVSVDGATVLLVDGTILAVGAILSVRGGNAGGGRSAAAMELAKMGLGVKVSNDGKVSYWVDLMRRKNSTGRREPPRYEVG